MRRIGANATADVRDRFRTFADGVRLLVVAGLVPMLLFCVVFMVARGVHWGVGELLRALRGPVDASTGIAFLPWFGVAQMACYTVMLVGLIAAAVDRIIARRDEAEAAARTPVAPTPSGPTAEPQPAPAARARLSQLVEDGIGRAAKRGLAHHTHTSVGSAPTGTTT